MNNIDAAKFVAYYEARGWMLGKKKMVSWKAAVRTWERSGYNTPSKSGGVKPEAGKYAKVGTRIDSDEK